VDITTNPGIHDALMRLQAAGNKTGAVERVNVQLPAIDLSKSLPAGHDVVRAAAPRRCGCAVAAVWRLCGGCVCVCVCVCVRARVCVRVCLAGCGVRRAPNPLTSYPPIAMHATDRNTRAHARTHARARAQVVEVKSPFKFAALTKERPAAAAAGNATKRIDLQFKDINVPRIMQDKNSASLICHRGCWGRVMRCVAGVPACSATVAPSCAGAH
jgi:hypothetical protein